MKLKFQLLITLLALASPSFSQTWLPVIPSESPTLTVALPVGSTIRWCDVATGKTCSPTETIASGPPITAYCPSVPSCNTADQTDGLIGVAKNIQVLETSAAQTVTLTDSSVTPAKVTTIIVPALPPASWPPVTFVPGTVYPLTLTNIVPASGPPSDLLTTLNIPASQFVAGVLQNFTMTTTIGGVPMTCTGAALTAAATISLNCIPAPLPAK